MSSSALGRLGPVEPAPFAAGEGGGSLADAYARARSAAAQRHPVRVIVLGDRHRGDDAVAFPAVREALEGLSAAVVDRLDVRETGQLDPADLVELASAGRAIVVDAVVGVPAGEVVVLPLTELAIRAVDGAVDGPTPRSSHVLPVDQLVALAAALRGRPPVGVLVGVGAASFELGAGLSAGVAEALPSFSAAIRAEIERVCAELAEGG